jgi:putative hemolysin
VVVVKEVLEVLEFQEKEITEEVLLRYRRVIKLPGVAVEAEKEEQVAVAAEEL